MQKTASITLHVDAECEACDYKYDYQVTLSNTTSNALSIVCEDPTPGLMKQIQQGDFGVRRCPKCGWLQSWMAKEWKDNWETVAFVLSIPFFIFVVILIGAPWPDRGLDGFGDLVVFALALCGYVLLLCITAFPFNAVVQPLLKDPNKRWHRRHGPDDPAPKLPNVQIVPPGPRNFFTGRMQVARPTPQSSRHSPDPDRVERQIVVPCPTCKKSMTIRQASSGARFSCPHCQQPIEFE